MSSFSEAAKISALLAGRASSCRSFSTGASVASKPRTSSARKRGKPSKPSACAKRLAVATDIPTASANSSMRMVAARNGLASTYSAMRWCAGVSVASVAAMRSEIDASAANAACGASERLLEGFAMILNRGKLL